MPLNLAFFRRYFRRKPKEVVKHVVNPEFQSSQGQPEEVDKFEIARECITIGERIGMGTFGEVFCGELKLPDMEADVQCCVKQVENCTSNERLHFLMEANILKEIHSHPFIVSLYGVVTIDQPTLVVLEYFSNGTLRDYLRSKKPADDDETHKSPPIPRDQVRLWIAQIADAMAFLEWRNFCHRNLCAHNIMLTDDLTAKIADFGMARDVYFDAYHRSCTKRFMQVRWMAPETFQGVFTSKSDVWAFGVTIFEMVTMGSLPYRGVANEAVRSMIMRRLQIFQRPTGLPDEWWALITTCMRFDMNARPGFRAVLDLICDKGYITDEFFRQRSFYSAWKAGEVPAEYDNSKPIPQNLTLNDFRKRFWKLPDHKN